MPQDPTSTAPSYFNVISTENAPQFATDNHYELACHLAAMAAAASKDPEAVKAAIWGTVVGMGLKGVPEGDIIGVLAAALAISAVEMLSPAADMIEEANPGFDYRTAIGRALQPETQPSE